MEGELLTLDSRPNTTVNNLGLWTQYYSEQLVTLCGPNTTVNNLGLWTQYYSEQLGTLCGPNTTVNNLGLCVDPILQ